MNNNNYNEYTDGIITTWAGKSEDELITIVATEFHLPREQLASKIAELKKHRYNGSLSYWQIFCIAIRLKKDT